MTSPGADFRHILSLQAGSQAESDGSDCFAVYVNDEDCATGVVVPARWPSTLPKGAIALAGENRRSLPPIDAVFLLGSHRVKEWLAQHSWDPAWGYNGNFPDADPAEAYEREFQSQCPLYSKEPYAVLGGWHFPWPDGDWQELLSSELFAWTFRDAEPWVEVWRSRGGFNVVQRTT